MSPTRPGTSIILRDSPTPRGAPTDTGVWFVVGETEKGQRKPILLRSMDEFKRKLGARLLNSVLYDALETFFREGGVKAYVSRAQNVNAVKATLNLLDAAVAVSLTVNAESAGVWGNSLRAAVTAGGTAGTFIITISHAVDGVLEVSPELVDTAAAVAWGTSSQYVTIAQGASVLDPAVIAATALATGADGTAPAEAEYTAALAMFTRDLGPGQVSMPGRTTLTAQTNLLAHAATNNRFAIVDQADVAVAATLKASGVALRSLTGARNAMLSGSWVKIPGLTPNTFRTVPGSALIAGLIGRMEGRGESPNIAAAGANGQAEFSVDVTATFTDAERDDMYLNGSVNLTRLMYGGLRLYGWRTLANPATLPNWINAGNSRLYMAVAAKADAIAESFVLQQIDGKGLVIKEFEGALRGMLAPYHADGSLYGATPDEAYNVETGAAVNTPQTIADGQLRAVLALRMSPFAELVTVEIVKVGVTEAVA